MRGATFELSEHLYGEASIGNMGAETSGCLTVHLNISANINTLPGITHECMFAHKRLIFTKAAVNSIFNPMLFLPLPGKNTVILLQMQIESSRLEKTFNIKSNHHDVYVERKGKEERMKERNRSCTDRLKNKETSAFITKQFQVKEVRKCLMEKVNIS